MLAHTDYDAWESYIYVWFIVLLSWVVVNLQNIYCTFFYWFQVCFNLDQLGICFCYYSCSGIGMVSLLCKRFSNELGFLPLPPLRPWRATEAWTTRPSECSRNISLGTEQTEPPSVHTWFLTMLSRQVSHVPIIENLLYKDGEYYKTMLWLSNGSQNRRW